MTAQEITEISRELSREVRAAVDAVIDHMKEQVDKGEMKMIVTAPYLQAVGVELIKKGGMIEHMMEKIKEEKKEAMTNHD